MGGTGYGGLGNGLRIGGSGRSSTRSFTRILRDTTWELATKVSWGGLLVEKAGVHEKMNYIIGGMFGGGSISVQRRSSSGSIFDAIDFDDDAAEVSAGLLMLEGHGGFTCSLTP
jgi:hypothetical protein